MFIKEDFIKYFNQISDIEKRMIVNVEELIELIKEETLAPLLEKIKKDEIKHMHFLEEINKIIHTDTE